MSGSAPDTAGDRPLEAMGANLRVIRRKIKTVGNIWQITRAMQMVAASKLKRVQPRVESSR